MSLQVVLTITSYCWYEVLFVLLLSGLHSFMKIEPCTIKLTNAECIRVWDPYSDMESEKELFGLLNCACASERFVRVCFKKPLTCDL